MMLPSEFRDIRKLPSAEAIALTNLMRQRGQEEQRKLALIEEKKELEKKLRPAPGSDPTKMGGSNGGPAILPSSSGV